ncbi:MAG TPA: MBL fold metallo-hydrolase [Candidatus Hydrogenedentes bacterium]|nr:MBL fold metallo-hydrolase [Candidatus Hydrogenedentota bacterium]
MALRDGASHSVRLGLKRRKDQHSVVCSGDYMQFLGTAGGRHVVARQLRASGGIFLRLEQVRILMDPGPGSLVQCVKAAPPIDPANLDGIVVTHGHIDHANDVNIIIDAMTGGGDRPRGTLFAPRPCYEGDTSVLYHYLRDFLKEIVPLGPRREYAIGNVRFRTSGAHRHSAETYGVIYRTPRVSIGFMVDTVYDPDLLDSYRGAEMLVFYATFHRRADNPSTLHYSVEDAEEAIAVLRPRKAFLTHMGLSVLAAGPDRVAKKLSDKLGVEVIAAQDGMVVSLP